MATTTAPPVAGTFTATNPTAPKAAKQTDLFSSDGFLGILAAQMRGQNPLEPMKDTEFLAQMAQFSQLEQVTSLAKDMKAMNMSGRLAQGAALIGRTVSYVPSGATQPVSGVVQGVTLAGDGRSMSLIVGGVPVDASLVTRVGA